MSSDGYRVLFYQLKEKTKTKHTRMWLTRTHDIARYHPSWPTIQFVVAQSRGFLSGKADDLVSAAND